MKRLLLVLVLVCLAAAAFAGDLSVGVGASGSYYMQTMKGPGGEALTTGVPFNFMAFLDSTYLEAAVGYRTVHGFHTKVTPVAGPVSESDDNTSEYSYLTLAAYLRLPIPLGSIALIPMIGVEYDYTLAATNDVGAHATSSQLSDLSSLWIKGGLGIEVPISSAVYLRPECLFGYQLNNEDERKTIDYYLLDSIQDLNVELAVLLGVRL